MSEHLDYHRDEQTTPIETQQGKVEAPEKPEEAEISEKEKKKKLIAETLQHFPDALKIADFLERTLPLQEAEEFSEQLKLLQENPAQQEKFWKEARKLSINTANLKAEDEQALREKEWQKIQSAFSQIFGKREMDLQILGRLEDQWKSLQIESERGNFDEARVSPKRKELEKFGFETKTLQNKQNDVGRLTFEVFADDVFAGKVLPVENIKGMSLEELYHQWMQLAIKEVAKLDHNSFRQALENSHNNNFYRKKAAEEKILIVEQDHSLSPEEKTAKKQAIHQEWQQQAIAENKMLNRQEIVFSALVEHKWFYRNNGSELIYKLQIIGKSYYNTKDISVDGKWGPQTSTVAQQLLLDFQNDPNFPEEAKATLEKLLKTRKHYENQQLKKKLQENQLSNQFDLSPVLEKSSSKKEKEEKSDFGSDHLTKTGEKKNEVKNMIWEEISKQEQFNDFSLQEIENTIPQDEYLASLKEFLQGIQKKNPNKAELQSLDVDQLALLIFEGNVSDPLHQKIAQAWEKSVQKKALLEQQQSQIKDYLDGASGQVALNAAEQFFGKFGIKKNTEKSKETLPEGYFTFQDANGKEFYYRPSSWNFSTQVFHTHDKERKQIDMGGDNYRILFFIPKYSEFIQKAAQDNYLLTGERPKSRQELESRLHTRLSNQITHTAGTIEQAGIDHIVKEEQTKTTIMQKMSKLFDLQSEQLQLKEEQSPALYQLFKPFVNSCEHASISELQRLEKFVAKAEEMKSRSQEKNRNLTPETNLAGYTEQLQPKTPDELLQLVLQPRDLLELKKSWSAQNANFGLQKVIDWLTSSQTGKDHNHDKIDDQKLKFLLNPEERDKSNNQQYRNSFDQLRREISGRKLEEAGDKESEMMGKQVAGRLGEVYNML